MNLQYYTTAPLSLNYYERMLNLMRSKDEIEFITYNDLCWGEENNYRESYSTEFQRWQEGYKTGRLSKDKIYILIQHDTDDGVQETKDMLKLENELGVVSSTMVFSRWRGSQDSEQAFEYSIDWEYLARLEKLGFCFGYHCNAFHNNQFKEEGLYDVFNYELELIREKLNINFFSPHGGALDDLGRGNAYFDYLEKTNANVKWVHNRYSPSFNGYFSDGAMSYRLGLNKENIDLESWVNSLKPGGRYRMLIHAQYFSNNTFDPLTNIQLEWYNRELANDLLLETYAQKG